MSNRTEQAIALVAERDLRFFDSMDVYNGRPRNAGEMMRLANREPLLDHAGAEVLAQATIDYAIPAMDERDLNHLIFCLELCPRKGVRA